MKPVGLFDPVGRKRLASMIVWGSGQKLTRHQIERRLEKVLERIAAKLDGKSPIGRAA